MASHKAQTGVRIGRAPYYKGSMGLSWSVASKVLPGENYWPNWNLPLATVLLCYSTNSLPTFGIVSTHDNGKKLTKRSMGCKNIVVLSHVIVLSHVLPYAMVLLVPQTSSQWSALCSIIQFEETEMQIDCNSPEWQPPSRSGMRGWRRTTTRSLRKRSCKLIVGSPLDTFIVKLQILTPGRRHWAISPASQRRLLLPRQSC